MGAGTGAPDAYIAKVLATKLLHSVGFPRLAGHRNFMAGYVRDMLLRHFGLNGGIELRVSADVDEARTFALKAAMHRAYPTLARQGCGSCRKPPVFYYTPGSPIASQTEIVAWKTLLSKHSFRMIRIRRSRDPSPRAPRAMSDRKGEPATDEKMDIDRPGSVPSAPAGPEAETSFACCYEMDLDALQTAIMADKNRGRLPCAVLATLGAKPTLGYQSDNIRALRALCDRHSIALIVEGEALPLCATPSSGPHYTSVFRCADAIVASPLRWLARGDLIPALGLTFLREDFVSVPGGRWGSGTGCGTDGAAPEVAYPNLMALWAQLALTDLMQINSLIEAQIAICDHLKRCLNQESKSFSVDVGPGPREPHAVIFRIRAAPAVRLGAFNLDECTVQSWIYSSLVAEGHQRLFSPARRGQNVVGLFFHPFDADTMSPCTRVQVEAAATCMRNSIEGLVRALEVRRELPGAVSRAPRLHGVGVLEIVDPASVDGFVGVGAVRYVPPFQMPRETQDSLNRELGRILASKAPTNFAVREASDWSDEGSGVAAGPRPCITIGPSVSAEDLPTAIKRVLDTAGGMDLPDDVMGALSDALRRGIEEAEQRMQSQEATQYHPLSLVRRAPILGSLIGWVFPEPSDGDAGTGHTFDIASQPTKSGQDGGESKRSGGDDDGDGEDEMKDAALEPNADENSQVGDAKTGPPSESKDVETRDDDSEEDGVEMAIRVGLYA